MSQWFVLEQYSAMDEVCTTSAGTQHIIIQADSGRLQPASVYSLYLIDSAPSSGQHHNKKKSFPLFKDDFEHGELRNGNEKFMLLWQDKEI